MAHMTQVVHNAPEILYGSHILITHSAYCASCYFITVESFAHLFIRRRCLQKEAESINTTGEPFDG